GARGIRGIRPVRGIYIRPVIDVYRRDIETYANENGVEHVVDSSNRKGRYLRNKIRMELIPFLKERYNPNIKEDVLRFSKSIEADDEFIEEMAGNYFKGLTESTPPRVFITGNVITLGLTDLLSIHRALRVRIIGRIWEGLVGHKKGLYSYHIKDIMSILESENPSAGIDLPSGIRFFREYGEVLFKKGGLKPIPSFSYELMVPGVTVLSEPGIVLKSEIIDTFDHKGIDIKTNGDTAFFDYDRLKLPLFVRGFKPGDRFRPFGMEGRKKVKDLFIDEKVARYERGITPILLSGGEIIWVVGVRRSANAGIEKTTGKVLKVEVVRQ
ncbi:MAG: tRNA lysidine(34) synthetase TilS, partial [Thermodesulfobacteriota bacterium]